LTRTEQRAFEKLVALGASTAGACTKIGIRLDAVWLTVATDERFRQRLEKVKESLDENVKAALYRSAMEGNVSAQTFWLRHLIANGLQPDEAPTDDLSSKTDEELRELELRSERLKRERERS
jgi:hypothetical protein